MSSIKKQAVIIGAGPAGLTAGIELLKTDNFAVTVIERDDVVGGLAKTTEYKGCRYDIGPHHFITDSDKIEKWWKDLMGDDFFPHKRFTRIYYKKHFFNYPLDPMNVIRGLSLFECMRCVLSYIKIRLFPIKNVTSFQDWVTNKFGHRLFSIFFKTYTEKVWGIACHKISSDWAAQRIKGFSLSRAIFYAFCGRLFKKNASNTLNEIFSTKSDVFYYPSKGSGTLWEKAAAWLQSFHDGQLYVQEEVVSVEHDGKNIKAVCTRVHTKEHAKKSTQALKTYVGDYFFSTMPLQTLIKSMDPLPSADIIKAAESLCYRGLITVNLIIDKAPICPDHWLYVHEKEVKMGRVGNMNNFSMKMVDKQTHTALSLEYFEFVGESMWKMSDADLVEMGRQELAKIGLIKVDDVIDGMVMRVSEAYPIYDELYHVHVTKVLEYLSQFTNLQLMGRNGLHRYNNMDIAMLSAFSAVEKVKDLEKKRDVATDSRPESHVAFL